MVTPRTRTRPTIKARPTKEAPAAAIEFGSLAVKYRPRKLSDLVGQEAVVTRLKGMLKSRKFPHAFLITGDSGLGKTTTGRIISRYVNCHNPDPETHDPCGECVSCQYEKDSPDMLELNAADNRGIDDVRALIQSAKNMPSMGKYRVILLDECHMLTPQAVQALLLPLEEPPKRTLWIMCTTNPEKLPSTIISRCHHFALKPIEEQVIVNRLYRIGKREGVDFKQQEEGEKILKTIANFADGKMRLSISMLENAIYAIKSGEEYNTKTLIEKFLTTDEAELEQSACYVLAATMKCDLKMMIKSLRGGQDARGVMHKLRWLVQYLIDNAAGCAKFTPYAGKLFAKVAKEHEVRVSLAHLIQLQLTLTEIEQRMNTMSVDESVQLLSTLGSFAVRNQRKD